MQPGRSQVPWIVPMPSDRPGVHFTWKELTTTSTGLDNYPSTEHRNNLRMLCYSLLDPLRVHIGRPLYITSGYRSEAVNAAVGGSVRSYHLKGLAADCKSKVLDCHALIRAVIDSDIDFDQVIAYAPSRGGHIHIQMRLGRNRRQVLWAPKSGGYEDYNHDCS